MPDARNKLVDSIVGRGLIAAESIAHDLRQKLIARLARYRGSPSRSFDLARNLLTEFEPYFTQALVDTELASWVAGYDRVYRRLPVRIENDFLLTVRGKGGRTPPPSGGFTAAAGDSEPLVRFPLLEQAAARLEAKGAMTRMAFDSVAKNVSEEAFTIAKQSSVDTIAAVQKAMVEDINEGTSLDSFRTRIEETIEGTPIGPAHLENVYRTNVQRSFHEGHDALASDPIVAEIFPYQEYLAIHDSRARLEHVDLEKLGLNGTNIYRRDDPFWDLFTPPWDYQCRCGINLLTIEDAAKRGVKEAITWLRTGRPPLVPEWRLDAIPFRPRPEWSRRVVAVAV